LLATTTEFCREEREICNKKGVSDKDARLRLKNGRSDLDTSPE
jgi:hypothetical protein